MTVIRQPKRRRHATKRLNIGPLIEALEKGGARRLWTAIGIVTLPEGESQHWELVSEGGQIVDILVDVEFQPTDIDVTCRLGSACGGGGRGIWSIPSVGAEVIVDLPQGELAFMPTIVAVLSSGDVPNPTGQGPTPTRTIIVDTEVMVHDGTGGAEPLVKKSEFESHAHDYKWTDPAGSGTTDLPDPITGTEVLSSK